MANTRDGGYVIIGVDEDGSGIVPTGLSDEDAATWTFEALTAGVAEYADPHVELDLRIVVHDEKRFGMVRVEEFAEVPVLCRKTYHNAGAIVLREGACYVRPRRRIETSEIATFSEMRDLLDLAIEKSTRRFVERAYRAGLLISLGAAPPTNDDRFRQQREGF
jgi:predicted HTH transcriptional regulator